MKLDTKPFEAKMKKTIESYAYTLSTLRAGRASADLLSPIKFEYYGSPTPISQMAEIKATDARTLVVQPWDASTLKAIEKAIQTSDLGINPINDGRVIRLVVPQMTEESRKELAKVISKHAEEAKVAIRNLRRDANEEIKKLKKDSIITEDDQKNAEKAVQDLTDKYVKKVDEVVAKKDKEIMEL